MKKADLLFRCYIIAVLLQCCACELIDITNEQGAIVEQHNNFRRLEEAANMQALVWDDDIAVEAALWTETCNFEHQGGNYGENLAMETFNESPPPALDVLQNLIGLWEAEKPEMGGHYTQMIWATTNRVGCALSNCPILQIGTENIPNGLYLACFYTPPGNYEGELPFIPGQSCSQCEIGMACVEDLCSPNLSEVEEEEEEEEGEEEEEEEEKSCKPRQEVGKVAVPRNIS